MKRLSRHIESACLAVADRVAERLNNHATLNYGLLGGDMGRVIFLYLMSKEYPEYEAVADESLGKILHTVRQWSVMPTYCNGLAGFGIGLMYLEEEGFVEGAQEHMQDIDRVLTECVMKPSKSLRYLDFLHGVTGIMYYFLKRSAGGVDISEVAGSYIEYLERYAIMGDSPDGKKTFKWDFHDDDTMKQYPICLSHGTSAIAILLSRLSRILKDEVLRKKCVNLAEGIADYLMMQSMDTKVYRSLFPSFSKECATPNMSRLGWCYGDTGIGMALYSVAKVTGRKDLMEMALKTIRHTLTERRNPMIDAVRDACLCHGASGIAQYFKALSGRDLVNGVEDGERYWHDMVLTFMQPVGSKNVGFPGYDMTGHTWFETDSVLDGSVGVVLYLLGADRFLNEVLLFDCFNE